MLIKSNFESKFSLIWTLVKIDVPFTLLFLQFFGGSKTFWHIKLLSGNSVLIQSVSRLGFSGLKMTEFAILKFLFYFDLLFSEIGQMSLESNTRYREQSIRLLFLVVPFAVLFFNIIWLAFDWPGIIKVRLRSFFITSFALFWSKGFRKLENSL